MIIGLSMKEREQLVTFKILKKGVINQKAAAKRLECSTRWAREKFKRFLEEGAKGLAHRNRGRPSEKAWNKEEKEFAMSLFEEEFKGFGPTFAAEKLKAIYGIDVSSETLRNAMIEHRHWKEKVKKTKHRALRDRKEFYGELVQLDGSPHEWFEGSGEKLTLLVFIDDATGKIPIMKLVSGESTENVMLALRSYIENNGRPLALYVDFGGVFSVNVNNPDREKKTQFRRACDELGIEIKYAHSPQAKGRVERSNKTHQDRLIKEFRLAGISTVEEANLFIEKEYLPNHNKRYAKPATKEGDVHRSTDNYNLDKTLCLKEERVIQNDFVVQYKKRLLQITSEQKAVLRPKELVTVLEQFDGTLSLEIRGISINFREIQQRIKPEVIKPKMVYRHHKPADNHPWRAGYKEIQQNQFRGPKL